MSIDVGNNVSLNTGDVFSNVGSKAEGNAGEITISANFISLNNGTQIQSGVFKGGLGNSNNVTLNARGNVTIISGNEKASGIFTDVETNSIYNAGNIKINAQGSIILNDASLNSKNAGDGVAGEINLNARNKLAVSNDSVIYSDGFFGRIFLNSSNSLIEIKDSYIFNDSENDIKDSDRFNKIAITSPKSSINISSSSITSKNTGTGFSGDINIDAIDEILIRNSKLAAEGNSGRITIGNTIQPSKAILEGKRTENNSEFNFSNLLSTTNSNPDDLAASITINARDRIDVIGSEIESTTETTRTSINVGSQDDNNFSTIKLKTAEKNLAGVITISTESNDNNLDPKIFSSIELKSSKGSIILDRSTIRRNNFGTGYAGDINLNARDQIDLTQSTVSSNVRIGRILIGKSDIYKATSSPQTANFPSSRFEFVSGEPIKSGNVRVTLKDKLVMRNDSDISTQASENVNGGNINISADAIISFDDSDIFAFAQEGRGGNITLNTPAYFGSSFNVNYSKIKPNSANRFFENNDRADLNATGAVSGTIQIPDVSFIQNSLANIYQNFIRTEDIIANSCVSPSQRKEGKFMITGAGGLPQSPLDEEQTSTFPTGEVRNLSDRSWQKGDPIEEPTGVYELENGELVMSRECFSK